MERQLGQAAASNSEFKPAEEIERALRNMAGLPRGRRSRNLPPALDPAKVLADETESLENFISEFGAKLSLWRRTRKTIEFEGLDGTQGRQWLRSTFTAINNGRHEDFSLPNRIIISVPFNLLLNDKQFSLKIIDTRGIDGNPIRPDILGHLNDNRTIPLLCSKWGSAPDPSIQNLLTYVNETYSTSIIQKSAIIALARAGDALSMRHDSGEPPDDINEGYDIKIAQVEDALQKIKIPVLSAFAFDAVKDNPNEFTKFAVKKISELRKIQSDAAAIAVAEVNEVIAIYQKDKTLAAINAVSLKLSRFAKDQAILPKTPQRTHDRLLGAIRTLHARTVWATARRAGDFHNFNVFQYIGDSAAAEAKGLSSSVVSALSGVIKLDLSDPQLEGARGFLTQIQTYASQWETDFIDAVRHQAVSVYKEPLENDRALWKNCAEDYGLGFGNYREGVSQKLSQWFKENIKLREELEYRIARAWEMTFVEPLKNSAGKSVSKKQ
jgi:hypothetical protein